MGTLNPTQVRTLVIAPLHSESPPQKRSGMARILEGFYSFTCTPTRSSAIRMSHTIPAFAFRAVAGTHLPIPEEWKADGYKLTHSFTGTWEQFRPDALPAVTSDSLGYQRQLNSGSLGASPSPQPPTCDCSYC